MTKRAQSPPSPFWEFSLSLYERKGVAAACIALQDRHQLDVNLLLFCVFAGVNGRELSQDEIAQLDARVALWRQNVIHPLRGVRRWLAQQSLSPKDAAEPLRRGVLAREIDAEAVEQRLIETEVAISEGAPDQAIVAGNLLRYARWSRVTPDAADVGHLAVALSQACALELEVARAVLQNSLSALSQHRR
jgi:uncharacterized protein (TIGR02444 family)